MAFIHERFRTLIAFEKTDVIDTWSDWLSYNGIYTFIHAKYTFISRENRLYFAFKDSGNDLNKCFNIDMNCVGNYCDVHLGDCYIIYLINGKAKAIYSTTERKLLI